MSYHVKRIDPFWKASPVVLAVAAIGLVLALFGYQKAQMAIAGVGAALLAVGVLMATKPAVSAILGSLGLFGGLVTFVILPNPQTDGLGFGLKLVSTGFFALLYMVLMDALVLVVSALYNFFGGGLGLGGIRLDIEEDAE